MDILRLVWQSAMVVLEQTMQHVLLAKPPTLIPSEEHVLVNLQPLIIY